MKALVYTELMRWSTGWSSVGASPITGI